MALILNLRIGERVSVGDVYVTLDAIHANTHYQVSVGDYKFDITDDKMTEVLPEVYISAGARTDERHARVAIDAPRDILILREELVEPEEDRT